MRFFNEIHNKLKKIKIDNRSLEFRFIHTFIILVSIIALTIFLLFILIGVFDINRSQTAVLFDHELSSVSQRIESEYASISSHSLYLAKEITMELERKISSYGYKPAEIKEHPEKINELLESVYPTMSAEIKALRSSGVFVVLDATINRELENAENSKACVYLKNISGQNNTYSSRYDIRYLYGPLEIGRNHELTFLPQWGLELDITNIDFYNTIMERTIGNTDKTLSQLYYWTDKSSDGSSDEAMYCVVPLIAFDGTIMGICGFEVGTMQFKLAYAPNVSGYDYMFCMMAPSDTENIYFENAMFAGNYVVAQEQPKCTVKIPTNLGLQEFDCEEAGKFVGKYKQLKIYPLSSIYAQEKFSIVLLTPNEQINAIYRASSLKYIGVIFLLTSFALIISIRLAKKNIKPIQKALDDIKKTDKYVTEKTNIKEIDDLFDFLAEKDKKNEEEIVRLEKEMAEEIERGKKAQEAFLKLRESNKSEKIDAEEYERFKRNLSDLTAKEREVFNLYLQGLKAKDIALQLDISMNTIKYHNKNIYNKLEVSSRKELINLAKSMQNVNA